MQANKTDNVIFLKNLESNIIDEAFVILKKDVNIKMINDDKKTNNVKYNILKDAEKLINQEIEKNNEKYDKYKIKKLETKIKILKMINIFDIVIFIGIILFLK